MAVDASVSVSSATNSGTIQVDWRRGAPITAAIVISDTATADLQFTLDDIDSSPTWITDSNMTGLTSSDGNAIVSPVKGLRVNCTAHTSGTVTLKVLQGDES